MKLIMPDGKIINLRTEFFVTASYIKSVLGAASATHDGYLRKEDFIIFSAGGSGGGTGGNAGQAIDIDMGTITTPNPQFSLDLGSF